MGKLSKHPGYVWTLFDSRDSGGIRGIIELEALRTIEEQLGGALPIQAFFDLIVGTRYGSTFQTHHPPRVLLLTVHRC